MTEGEAVNYKSESGAAEVPSRRGSSLCAEAHDHF